MYYTDNRSMKICNDFLLAFLFIEKFLNKIHGPNNYSVNLVTTVVALPISNPIEVDLSPPEIRSEWSA